MIRRDQIGWSRYKNFEGPMWFGIHRAKIADTDSFERIAVRVTSAAEGNLDAAQLYDSCVFTGGFQQWCSTFDGLVRMLLFVEKRVPGSLSTLFEFLRTIDASISAEKRAFVYKGTPVRDYKDRRDLFLAGGSGNLGEWKEHHKERAYGWVLAFANCPWQDPAVAEAQIDYATTNVYAYMRSESKWLFEQSTQDPWVLALRAAYLSFAANNPTRAATTLNDGVKKTSLTPWTPAWVLDLLHAMTWDAGVDILPHRYNAIRPVLERCFGVDLPDVAGDLKRLRAIGQDPMGADGDPTGADSPRLRPWSSGSRWRTRAQDQPRHPRIPSFQGTWRRWHRRPQDASDPAWRRRKPPLTEGGGKPPPAS